MSAYVLAGEMYSSSSVVRLDDVVLVEGVLERNFDLDEVDEGLEAGAWSRMITLSVFSLSSIQGAPPHFSSYNLWNVPLSTNPATSDPVWYCLRQGRPANDERRASLRNSVDIVISYFWWLVRCEKKSCVNGADRVIYVPPIVKRKKTGGVA